MGDNRIESLGGATERSSTARAAAPRIKFACDTGFHGALKAHLQEYLRLTNVPPQGGWRMYLKTAVILLWLATSYGLLVFAATVWWEGALLSLSLALAMAGTGFAIQHDANHGAYSKRAAVNRLMGLTLDLVGASSYVWHWKHNILHHTYPNLPSADDDIDFLPFARLAPAQPRYWAHRFQQFYLWALYGFLYPKWNFIDDFKSVARARISLTPFPRPRGWNLVQAIGGKVVFFGWAFIIPLLFHPWWVVLSFYATTAFTLGIVLAVVFQLAHCVEEASFQTLPAGSRHHLTDGWAIHQVRSSVNFAPQNRLLTWYVGGLNFQIEHHLFPKISHLHYPRISPIVRAVCAAYGVRYAMNDTFLGALASHGRWLRRMGQPAASSHLGEGDRLAFVTPPGA
ncbi:MAG: acyl-CoA desaturase [Haliangium ochraceum]